MTSLCSYFVDEAGDGTVFDKNGSVVIGTQGCSNFFILGLLQVDDPPSLEHEFNLLRTNLLADPYFKGVPSMQSGARKTALAFHAKDDLPEVRREVFSSLIKRKDLRFLAVVRDKRKLLAFIRAQNAKNATYHYDPNELYDYLTRRLFRDRLHQYDDYKIIFAQRGSSDRTQALKQALNEAKNRFSEINNSPVMQISMDVVAARPPNYAGLQSVDYFLWTIQRLFERGEDRYVSLLWPSIRLVIDMDDNRIANYGAYYTQKKPLNYAAIEGRK